MSHFYADDISLKDFQRDLEGYSWPIFRQDALAAITVALLTLPQAMAYALLAGLPLYCGLFAVIYSSILASCFGSSRHLVVGPSNAIAILIQSGTSEILYTYFRDVPPGDREIIAVQVLTQLSLVVGLLQVLAAWFKLGRLTQFVSHSVIVGYIAGTSIAMVISQLFVFFGIPRMTGVHSLYENGVYLLAHVHQIEWPSTIVGLCSLVLLVILKRINKKIPAGAIAFVVAGLSVELLGLSSYSGSSHLADLYNEDHWLYNVKVIGDTGEVYEVFPTLDLPFFNMRIINGILPSAIAIALLGVMETTSVAKSIAATSGQRLSMNQDIFGIGLGNMAAAFFGGMPVSGSPSRSCLNFQTGGQTRFAPILSAFFVALFIFLLGFLVTRIPLSALAALLLVTATSIVNTRHLMTCLRATSSDAFVLWTTLLACIFFSLDIAFYIGVALSITLYLKRAAIPQLVEYVIEENGDLRNLDPAALLEKRPIRVIKVEGELFFGSADLFQTTLKSVASDDDTTRVIILQLKNARDIDATTCLALQQLQEFLNSSGRHLVACGLTPHVWEVLSNSGLVELMGKENLFMFEEKHPHLHMQQALMRAKELIASSAEVFEITPEAPETGEGELAEVPIV
jgi:SulP family sulfate permease